MIIEADLTADADAVDATSFATASITPTSNHLVLAAVSSSEAGGPLAPTVTGNDLTWVQINSRPFGGDRRVTLFRALGTFPTAGAVTFDFGAVTQLGCAWALSEFTGIDTGGLDGEGAIVQSATDLAVSATPSVGLAAFSDIDNGAVGTFYVTNVDGFTPGSGFLDGGQANAAGAGSILLEWRNGNDQSVDCTCTSDPWGGVAIELKAAILAPRLAPLGMRGGF